MKKHDLLKTIQLAAFCLIALILLGYCLLNGSVRYAIANEDGARYLFIILWVLLILSFVFLFAEFSFSSKMKKDFSDLKHEVNWDSLSGINNRRSADSILKKYQGDPPSGFAVIMTQLSNIAVVNELEGRMEGNELIRDFSAMMSMAASGSCFVARNDGCRFIVIFEHASSGDVSRYLTRLKELCSDYSRTHTPRIEYICGNASARELPGKSVQDIVALACKRMYA